MLHVFICELRPTVRVKEKGADHIETKQPLHEIPPTVFAPETQNHTVARVAFIVLLAPLLTTVLTLRCKLDTGNLHEARLEVKGARLL